VKSFEDAVVVVAGAASGIGRATALTFSRLGARLVLADIQSLDGVAGEIAAAGHTARAFPLDVTEHGQVIAFAAAVLREFGRVDVVVNSAGVLVLGETRLVPVEDLRWIMGVNFWGVVHLLHAFLPSMVERKRGHFVNISSPNAMAPVPYVGAYAASKSAMTVLSETLRLEVARYGVGVTTVCPGFTRTGLRGGARYRSDNRAGEEFLARVRERIERTEMDPFKVAGKIPDAVRKNRALVRISAETYFLSWGYRFAPGLFRRIAQAIYRRTP